MKESWYVCLKCTYVQSAIPSGNSLILLCPGYGVLDITLASLGLSQSSQQLLDSVLSTLLSTLNGYSPGPCDITHSVPSYNITCTPYGQSERLAHKCH